MPHKADKLEITGYEPLFCQQWLPDNPPKAVVLIAHGLAEHSSRYQLLATFLNQQSIGVYALDHLGHGKSPGRRGHINHFDDFLKPLLQLLENVEQAHPQTPIFLLGHSMGGLMALSFVLQHQQRLAGCILSGAALSAGAGVSETQIRLLAMLAAIWPKLPALQLDSSQVCSDPAVVDDYRNDPFVYHGKVSTRLVRESLRQMEDVEQRRAAINLPVLILHGGSDLMVAPLGSEALYTEVGSTDKTLKIYDGLYHEIFHEPIKAAIFEEVAQWVKQRI